MRAEQVTDPVAYHGEGPVWSERWGGLRWVDMLAGDVLSLRPDGTVERRHVGTVAAALRPRSRGGAVIGVERGFALEEPDGTLTTLDELWTDTGRTHERGRLRPRRALLLRFDGVRQDAGRRGALPARPGRVDVRRPRARDDLERARVEPRRLARLLQRHRHPSRRRLRLRPRDGPREPTSLRPRGRTAARTGSPSTPRAASGSRSTTAARSAVTRPTAPWTQSSRSRRAR